MLFNRIDLPLKCLKYWALEHNYKDGRLYLIYRDWPITPLFFGRTFSVGRLFFIYANSADPDEILLWAALHLGLHCLPKYQYPEWKGLRMGVSIWYEWINNIFSLSGHLVLEQLVALEARHYQYGMLRGEASVTFSLWYVLQSSHWGRERAGCFNP